MILYGQMLRGEPTGAVSIRNCEAREDAVFVAVDMAISAGWRPPRWWEFWRDPWPADCRAEYERRKDTGT